MVDPLNVIFVQILLLSNLLRLFLRTNSDYTCADATFPTFLPVHQILGGYGLNLGWRMG